MYYAIYLPASECPPSDGGPFETTKEAEEHVASYLCHTCSADYARGYDEEQKWPVSSPMDTMCGAEWLIVDEEKLPDDEATLGELFEAAGMERVYEKS